MAVDGILEQLGVSPMVAVGVVVGVVVVVAVIALVAKSSPSFIDKVSVDLHTAQIKWLDNKEKKYCEGAAAGKGIRCIIDFLREAKDDQVKEILSEKPRFTAAFQPFAMSHVYPGQLDFLATHGIKVESGEVPDKYQDLSKAFRAMVDYAMRKEEEGDAATVEDMFATVRCLNC
eukprot:gnl/TRDRNA2_/TRDRNA2_165006_c0_seq1.p1 gnl/TRDRNA2_/TRDRNA2_165006_c0~~gnl/TRDRNA2_/TRDRNA2_165006_c0_seq1.p1  ORF type:complete len:197 (-),score=46.32 gnl/TRDRNA2_/TRDRNA2_165006_c0_seq1:480-1001(-)